MVLYVSHIQYEYMQAIYQRISILQTLLIIIFSLQIAQYIYESCNFEKTLQSICHYKGLMHKQ